MQLRSVDAVSTLQAGWRQLEPLLLSGGAFCRRTLARLARRLAGIDIVPSLIAATDGIETALRWVARTGRQWLPRRELLTNALAWRGAAALSGVGLMVALITGLSAKDEDQLKLTSLVAAAMNAPMRDGDAPRHARPPAAAEDWVAIPRTAALFSLEAPELDHATPALDARRSPDGSRREDLLRFGSLTAPEPHLLLRLTTGDGAATGARSFTVALVHEAAQQSLAVERSSAPAPIETRFGALETADVVLGNGKERRSCIAFRTPPGEAGFALGGWWCAANKPSDGHALACLLNRIALVDAAADPELRGLFARSGPRRQPSCAPSHQAASPDIDASTTALRAQTAGAEIAQIPPERRKPRPKPVRRQP